MRRYIDNAIRTGKTVTIKYIKFEGEYSVRQISDIQYSSEFGDDYIDALGHDIVKVDAQDPTCEEAGWYDHDTCSRCDYTTKVEIPATHQKTLKVVDLNNYNIFFKSLLFVWKKAFPPMRILTLKRHM